MAHRGNTVVAGLAHQCLLVLDALDRRQAQLLIVALEGDRLEQRGIIQPADHGDPGRELQLALLAADQRRQAAFEFRGAYLVIEQGDQPFGVLESRERRGAHGRVDVRCQPFQGTTLILAGRIEARDGLATHAGVGVLPAGSEEAAEESRHWASWAGRRGVQRQSRP